ncbi:MAG: type II toxin-antitoxin system Phd/YefM family antitoxin [Opitutus sp.]|nr:type II toxin-antitoxin system Phd/YefM family antitoxin [Opitutus sp.]
MASRMTPTYSIKEAQKRFPALVRRVEQGRFARIKRRGKPAVLVIGTGQLKVMMETAEILADPDAMKAIRDAEGGKVEKWYSPADLLD